MPVPSKAEASPALVALHGIPCAGKPRCSPARRAALPRLAAAPLPGGLLLSRAPELGWIFNPSLSGQRLIFLLRRNAIEVWLTFRVIP